uniref:MBOAT_2 domain-containing protein n=1 Tax=Macrostomum lignano TaxID=282301 RepID=A0A1I8F8R2_9PLAT
MSSATIKSQQSALEQSLPSIELLAYAAWFVIVLASVGHAFKTQIIPESRAVSSLYTAVSLPAPHLYYGSLCSATWLSGCPSAWRSGSSAVPHSATTITAEIGTPAGLERRSPVLPLSLATCTADSCQWDFAWLPSSAFLSDSNPILSRLLRLCFWLAFTVFVLHCFHAGAYLETLGIRQIRHRGPIDPAHLGFALYTRGQLFHLEYLQYYGWPALFASTGGSPAAHWLPACICGVVSYREMWRLFDRGLFAIVVRDHVYIPLGGSRLGLGRQLLATAASFGFICVYHGNYDSVQSGYCSILGSSALNCWLSDSTELRSGNLCSNGSAGVSPPSGGGFRGGKISFRPSMGIFFLFYGTPIGWLVMREMLWLPLTGQGSFKGFLVLYSGFYCTVQLAFEYKRRRSQDSNKD